MVPKKLVWPNAMHFTPFSPQNSQYWPILRGGPRSNALQTRLLSYFLSEVYFSHVWYILISHFLWKKCELWKKSKIRNSKCMEMKFETIQSPITPFSLPKRIFEKYSSIHKNWQHMWCPQNGNFFKGQIWPNFWHYPKASHGQYSKYEIIFS